MHSNLRTRIAVVATVFCMTGVVGAHMLSDASAVDRPALTHLGFYPGYGKVSALRAFETWLGRDTNYLVQFSDADSERAFTSSIWGQTVSAGAFQTVASSTNFVESVPLTIGLGFGMTTAQTASALKQTLSGAHDDAFRQGALYLKQAGFKSTTIRLGWEFDGDWMPWSSRGNEALWVSTYRHVANVFRSVLPNVRFDWNGGPRWIQAQMAAYPGDGYVDTIGLDVYDKGFPVAWNSSTKTWVDPAAAFAHQLPGMRFVRDFAIAHGKQVSYPEWALASGGTESPTRAGNDNPAFIQYMYDWMSSLPSSGPGSLAYHSYFNEDQAHDGNHALSHFPKAQARYRLVFGGAATASPTTATPTTRKPTTTTPTTKKPTTTTTRKPTTTTPTTRRPTTTTSTTVKPPAVTPTTKPAVTPRTRRATHGTGYSMLGADGKVYPFGSARNVGNASGPAMAFASRANGSGYWIVDPAGNVRNFGSAADHGGHPSLRSDEWVSAISATPSGNGYWLFTIRGRVFAYGDARRYGDLGAKTLNGPIVGSVATPSGHGYYMVASDGGVFGFGDARFRGSMGGTHVNKPIVGLSPSPHGRGYWLVASDGGLFAFNAPFRGSMGSRPLAQPVRGLVAYGNGYAMVASDGGVFTFSDKLFVGSLGRHPLSAPIVGIAAVKR